ncbi:MAG: phosphatase PAP2 family protein [Acidimicrobiales bacterium]
MTARQVVKSIDDGADELFRRLRGNPTADWVFYAASEAADYSLAWHVISIGMATASPNRKADAVRMATMLGVESIVVNGIVKRIVDRERPAPLENPAHDVRRPKTKSFPSGHASSATLAAVLLTDAYPSLRPVWVGLAATVAASRIHNRMHHASDVAAGAALGGVFGLVTKRLWPLR